MAKWQFAVVVAVTGITSGTAGAMFYSQLGSARGSESRAGGAPSVTVPSVHTAPPAAVIVPPGWDKSLLMRVSSLEQRLDQLPVAAASAATTELDAEPDLPSSEEERAREEQRIEQYQKELDYRDATLAAHAQEPADNAWAAPQVLQMQDSLVKAFGNSAQAKHIDCRSKTCTVTLAFPTPSEGLAAIQQQSEKLSMPGCKGAAAIPTPPKDAGPYEITILYNCRD